VQGAKTINGIVTVTLPALSSAYLTP